MIGASGAFGSRLARGILDGTGFRVILAARSPRRLHAAATDLQARHPGRVETLQLDATRTTPEALRATGAFALVDAAGPFQRGSIHLAATAIAAGVHYLDLADARDFVAGFAPALDAAAQEAGCVALTGCSTTPALSNAVLDTLLAGWTTVDEITVAILPGNRAPRGLSVTRAILSWVGKPLRVWQDGTWTERPGWSDTQHLHIRDLGRRRAALCETPDLDILPARHGVRRSARILAGLELAPLHLGLAFAGRFVSAGLLPSLAPFARSAAALARIFEHFGSDRGGMLVEARGRDAEGRLTEARWTLVAEGGEGPFIPTLPAIAALRRLAIGELAPGARACVGEVRLADIAGEFRRHRITTATETKQAGGPSLFAAALGPEGFAALPPGLRRLHAPGWWLQARGEASVEGLQGPLARLVARAFRLPPAAASWPIRVAIATFAGDEIWRRDFGGQGFRSRLSPATRPGHIIESFGPFHFELALKPCPDGLEMRLAGWRLGPLSLPLALGPRVRAFEGEDAASRFTFDVELALPFGLGRVVRYRGWLDAAADGSAPRLKPGRAVCPAAAASG